MFGYLYGKCGGRLDVRISVRNCGARLDARMYVRKEYGAGLDVRKSLRKCGVRVDVRISVWKHGARLDVRIYFVCSEIRRAFGCLDRCNIFSSLRSTYDVRTYHSVRKYTKIFSMRSEYENGSCRCGRSGVRQGGGHVERRGGGRSSVRVPAGYRIDFFNTSMPGCC